MSDVETYLISIPKDKQRAQARQLDGLFRRVTGWEPRLISNRMIGYGSYDYTYESGRSGTTLATGFSVQASKFSIYIMPGYANFGSIMNRLGKHKMAKSCCYFNKLEDIDLDVLAELIRAGLDDLGKRWPITPT